jgi:hypothetical protein
MPFKKGSRFPLDQIISDYKQGTSIEKLSKKYGISVSNLHYHFSTQGLIRSHSEGLCPDGWHKLINVSHSQTRLISIPSSLLRDAGFDPADELVGKWRVRRQKLILEIKRKED